MLFFFSSEFREFIPFTQPAPIDEDAKKQKKKGKKEKSKKIIPNMGIIFLL